MPPASALHRVHLSPLASRARRVVALAAIVVLPGASLAGRGSAALPPQTCPAGAVLVSALSFMLSTLLVDVLYAWIDPRISYEAASA